MTTARVWLCKLSRQYRPPVHGQRNGRITAVLHGLRGNATAAIIRAGSHLATPGFSRSVRGKSRRNADLNCLQQGQTDIAAHGFPYNPTTFCHFAKVSARLRSQTVRSPLHGAVPHGNWPPAGDFAVPPMQLTLMAEGALRQSPASHVIYLVCSLSQPECRAQTPHHSFALTQAAGFNCHTTPATSVWLPARYALSV